MYELKIIVKVFTCKYVGTGPSSYEKRIYRAAVSQRLRNTALNCHSTSLEPTRPDKCDYPSKSALELLNKQ